MKRFITVLSGLLVLPAFAEVAPLYYDEIVEYTDDMIDAEDEYIDMAQEQELKQNVAQRNTVNRSTTASRAIPASAQVSGQRANTSSRAIASSPRSSTRTARGTASRTARTAAVVNRPQTQTERTSVTSRGSHTSKPVTARVSTRNNSVIVGNRVNSNSSQKVLEDSGSSLYNANTSRVGVGSRRASARISTSSLVPAAVSTPVITEEAVSTTTNNLTAIAELTDYCKAQYAACMDNYCNVLDDNQGRCSCSKNIKNYAKTEEALAKATEDFQEAIQKIRYIGLTGEQIDMLFTETEAELQMSKSSDKSQLKTSLDTIKRKIVDVSTPGASSYSTDSGVSFDLSGLLNADFTAGFDINSFLNMSNNTKTASVSNQRGEQLYKTAASRCRTAVLNSCTAQGIDANVITNSYDLEIDKQCIAYERSLNEANKEMKNNVANAATILQQARLVLAQNRNSYDIRGCVAAIDSCMRDEYVCGSDYELCLDPTGKFIANGEILKGGTPGVSGGMSGNECLINSTNEEKWLSNGMYDLYSVWNYSTTEVEGTSTITKKLTEGCNSAEITGNTVKNAWGAGRNENLGDYIDLALTKWSGGGYKSGKATEDIATYLLQKVGYMDENDKVHGMCASVMKQCQDYTYNTKKSKREYKPNNEIVRQYLTSALTAIKLKQDEILYDYVEDCRADVLSCLSTNGWDESNKATTVSQTAINACASDIKTCMSVGGWKPSDTTVLSLRQMTDWVGKITASCETGYPYYDSATGLTTCRQCPTAIVLQSEGSREELTQAELTEAFNSTSKHFEKIGSYEGLAVIAADSHVATQLGEGAKWYVYDDQTDKYLQIKRVKGSTDTTSSAVNAYLSESPTIETIPSGDACACPEGYDYKHIVHTCTTVYPSYAACNVGTVHYCVKR